MVQRLLEERFQLRVHSEMREQPIYELVTNRADKRLGPNMRAAVKDCEPFLTGQQPMQQSGRDPKTGGPHCGLTVGMQRGLLSTRLNGYSTARLAQHLEAFVRRHVVDKTGVSGSFDIELTYVDEEFSPRDEKPQDGPALFTALTEQLGLSLRSARGPVDVRVIDSVQQPSPD